MGYIYMGYMWDIHITYKYILCIYIYMCVWVINGYNDI